MTTKAGQKQPVLKRPLPLADAELGVVFEAESEWLEPEPDAIEWKSIVIEKNSASAAMVELNAEHFAKTISAIKEKLIETGTRYSVAAAASHISNLRTPGRHHDANVVGRIASLEARQNVLEQRVEHLEGETSKQHEERERLLSAVRKVSTLEKVCAVDDADELVQHLATRPQLSALVLDAIGELKTRFDGAPTAIRWNGESFVLAVQTELPVSEAEPRLSRFVREWWSDKISLEDALILKLRYV